MTTKPLAESESITDEMERWKEFVKEQPELLKAPDMLYRIKKEFLDKDIVGEDSVKLLLFTIACTSLTTLPLGAILTGESSSGKSHVAKMVLKHFGNVEEFSRMTEASPDRMGGSFTNKILYISELNGVDESQSKIRILISEGKLRLLSCDMEGGGTTTVIETTGVPTFITTTTSLKPDTELLNRLFMVSIDETEKQTKNVLEFEAKQFMDISENYFKETEVSPLQNILEQLMVTRYRIPFADILARLFPCRSLKSRRDFKKLLNIIGTVAFLHQYQRPIVRHKNTKLPLYVLATPADFYMAFRIAGASLQTTLLNLQQRALETLSVFKEGETMSAGDVSVIIGKTQSTTRQILNSLVYAGFMLRNDAHKPYQYFIKQSINGYTFSVADFESIFVSFGETELNNYLVRNLLHARRRETPSLVVDPITGETLELSKLTFKNIREAEGIKPLPRMSRPPSPPSRACAKVGTKQETKATLIDSMFSGSVSSTEEVKAIKKERKVVWTAETTKDLKKNLFDTWSKESYYSVMSRLGFDLLHAESIFKRMEENGAIFSIDFDKTEWRWV